MHMKKILAILALWSAVSAVQLQGAPFITSFSPKYGASNDPVPVIIHGSGFANPVIVKFNGVPDPTAGTADGVSIQARVPVNAPLGPGRIFVSVGGQSTESTENFTVIGPGPYVAGFSPGVGNGGTSLTITGAHFFAGIVNGVQYGTLSVKFSGAGATNITPVNGQAITLRVPDGVISGPITVYNSKGTNISADSFLVPPAVSGFVPTSGRAGTNVVITGTNLLGVTSVQFNGLTAPDFTVLSNGAIRVTVPLSATTGKILVNAPAGFSQLTNNFVVQPTINGFTPTLGPAGTSVTLFGANFNVGTPVVSFNGVLAAAPTSVTFGQLTAVVPAGATTGPISVTTSDGTATNAAKFYLPAILTGVTPIFGSQTVTLTGTNFTDATAVKFNGSDAASFSVQSDHSIGAVVPFSASSGQVTVTTPAGTASNNAVKFYLPPIINAFIPTHGLPGTNVSLFGQNFLDATAVLFNGTNAPFTVINNTTLTTVVPTNALTGPITVLAPAGTNSTPVNFVLDYTANLVVTAIDSPDPVVESSNVTYSIIVSNGGPFAAPGLSLTDTLIGPAALKAASTTQGTLNTNGFPITGALGNINVGSTVIVTLIAAAQAPGMITNIASITSQYPDPNPANNSATNTTYVQPLPLLSVRRLHPDLVRVAWSSALTNYGLEFKAQLTAAEPWSNVTSLPAIVGGEYQLTETNTAAARYYRLRRLP